MTAVAPRSFAIGESDFLLDGEPFRVLSGALHYFRVHPGQWADRIRKARLMGLNTIETYVAWNAHEPRRGEWDATGWNDLGAFLDLVAAEGMHAIVRPGPYICAEWHNGGLPVWLTGLEGVGLRRSEPLYLAEVTAYLERVYEIVAPRQIDRGGPVVLVQIENEYGAYGDDTAYLEHLVRVTKDAGITVPLTTIDQPTDQMLSDGSVEGVHLTGSFGSRAAERLATLRRHQPTGPLMCAEFWDGWFDWWGNAHHTTPASASAAELDALLAAGASVNFYMFHGGTNYGLTNGANDKGRYLPIVTSYDYDAPLDERGDPTEKYFAFREVIAKYATVPDEVPAVTGPAPVFEVALESAVAPPTRPAAPLDPSRPPQPEAPLDAPAARKGAAGTASGGAVGTVSQPGTPPTFEELGHLSALVSYEAELPDGRGGVLRFGEVRDHAWLSVDGVPVGTLSRTRHEDALVVPDGRRVRVLVEEQGRVNYDVRLGESKGLIGPVTLDGVALTAWTATPIDVAALGAAAAVSATTGAAGPAVPDAASTFAANAASAGAEPRVGPFLRRGSFSLQSPADLFLDTAGWGKGYALVNGFLLGRYWSSGPQRTLYVPAAALHAGENSLVVIELDRVTDTVARFVAEPDLGPREE
ncbi:beta-galactosidase family protein [Microbacterium sp. B35-30]|uniref:glycoside hydrolase family 35 protein n=1 Tax=Microbacterium sp. B35-30 TaxID=1962642 RepID=UPI0013D06BAB|nr:beta-galactosidase family protein [Microbacterium sp. B35-30]KAF2420799.1 beta-galactosidase [Microbacterium sp. B35-30]